MCTNLSEWNSFSFGGMNPRKITHGALALWVVFVSGPWQARMLSALWTQVLYSGHVILYQPLLDTSAIQVIVEFPLLQVISMIG
jgi:hypothetical protein